MAEIKTHKGMRIVFGDVLTLPKATFNWDNLIEAILSTPAMAGKLKAGQKVIGIEVHPNIGLSFLLENPPQEPKVQGFSPRFTNLILQQQQKAKQALPNQDTPPAAPQNPV